jgi:hypothetical protein
VTPARAVGLTFSAILAANASSCRTIEGTRGLPPFYEVYDTPSSVGSEAGSETFFRPLGSYERLTIPRRGNPDAAVAATAPRPELEPPEHHVRVLSPLFSVRSGPSGTECSVLSWGPVGTRDPLFSLGASAAHHWGSAFFRYENRYKPGGGEDMDWSLFPLFFGGSDTVEGSYFAIFPLGGRLKGLFAQDQIDFYLFPLYWHSQSDERHSGDSVKHSLHLVWPFYNQVWGGDWSGWRVWPFYGRYWSHTIDGKLRYDRTFVLWPFYIRQSNQMHENPTELFFTLPFYGESTSRTIDDRAYLWPFFLTRHNKKYERKIYLGLLIPYRFTDGQADLWPLFGIKRFSLGWDVGGLVRRNYRHYFLWPIERYDWATDGFQQTTRFWLLPLLWHFHYIDMDTLETESEWTLWPLFRHRSVGQSVSFDFVSPLWFRRDDYDRLYSRWFNVFRYRWKPELSGWELLYGAVMYRREDATAESVFSVLGGLFECGSREGSVVLRFLYVPWW